jgi:hypothetical protein
MAKVRKKLPGNDQGVIPARESKTLSQFLIDYDRGQKRSDKDESEYARLANFFDPNPVTRHLPDEMRGMPGVGSMWTWTAICAESKLIVSWRLGARDAANSHAFCSDLSDRLANRVQLTTDGNRLYVTAAEDSFKGNVDYAQLKSMATTKSASTRSASAWERISDRLRAPLIGTWFRPATPSARISISECRIARSRSRQGAGQRSET